ncbi:MAG: hypothetical protein JST32_17820 [Bacteroidetes bacterium]|nr:hypothetical protein [Bacteroidota bacterium]
MKRIFKYVPGLVLAGVLSAALTPIAYAQRGFHGGGVHIGGGVGFGGFHGGIGFRSGFGLGYRGGSYIGGRHFYGYPTVGFHLGILPFGYFPFYWGDDLYYYYGGVFYAPIDGGGYQVTTPPVGAAVPSIPRGAQSIVIDGKQYYEFNGVYYQEGVDDQGKKIYVVAGKDGVLNTNDDQVNATPPAPQVGDVLNQVPEGSRKITLNHKKYYVDVDGIYYEEFTDQNGNKAYRIVSIPSADEHQQ